MRKLTIYEFLERLNGVKEISQGQWVALCPVHVEENPSLSIRVGATVPFLVHCHSCNAPFGEIMNAVAVRG